MTDRIAAISPLLKARVAGSFYLLSIVAGIAAEMIASQSLSRTANLIGAACYVGVTLILYDLLRPVSKGVSLLAAIFSLVGCVVTVFEVLDLRGVGINSLVFFGCYCLLLAYLIFRSTFMPRFLGVFLAITGLGWLTYISPALGHQLFRPYLMIGGLLGEGSLTLWLLAFGVDARRWREQHAGDERNVYARVHY